MIATWTGKKLRRARLIAVLAATAATATVLFTPSSAMAASTGFQAINQNSGLCMGVSGGSSALGAAVVQFPCLSNPFHGDQFWELPPNNIFSYGLVHNASMYNRCLGLKNSGTDEGTRAVSVACQSADWAQLWEQVPIPGLGYTLVNYKSGRCLGVPGGSPWPIQLVLWNCDGSLNQIWYTGARIN